MNFIVAADKNLGIGKGGGLLFRLPLDMKYFRTVTEGKVVVMGRKTFESLPGGALKNRVNIILSASGFEADGAVTVRDLQGLFKAVQKYDSGDIFVIGGGEVYKTLMPYCEKGFITSVDADGGADVFLQGFDGKNWQLISSDGPHETNGVNVTFNVYRNINPLIKG